MPMNPRLLRPLARFQAPPSAPTDPNFSSVSLLLHFDGTNGSTSFTDSSLSAKTFAVYGDASISTSQSQFGGASGYFDGSGDYISSSDALFDFSDNDWTIEFWMYPTSSAQFQCIFTVQNGINIHLYNDDKIYINNAIDGNGGFSDGSFGVNQWYYIAVTRESGTLRVFVDGALLGSSSTPFGTATSPLRIAGAYNAYFHGHIDELRVTQGLARYTAAFTPPAAPFPDQ